MNVLIVEDEPLASEQLESMITRCNNLVKVTHRLDSVEDTVSYFKDGNRPDLAFMDIQLSDGLSLDIFRKTEVAVPVIFTTAYDYYALQAFKVNSIDYLLKPVDPEELAQALDKYYNTRTNLNASMLTESMAGRLRDTLFHSYKKRFVVRQGNKFLYKNVSDIALIRAEGRSVYIYPENESRKYLVDHTMEELENNLLDPEVFFRINRQFFVSANNVAEARTYVNSRLKIILDVPCEYELVVSRERVPYFKDWISR